MIVRKSFESEDAMGFALINECGFITEEILVVTDIHTNIRKKIICANLLAMTVDGFETTREVIEKEIASIMDVTITFI
jgi:hypothetical protein